MKFTDEDWNSEEARNSVGVLLIIAFVTSISIPIGGSFAFMLVIMTTLTITIATKGEILHIIGAYSHYRKRIRNEQTP